MTRNFLFRAIENDSVKRLVDAALSNVHIWSWLDA